MFSCHQVGKFTIEAASGSVSIPGAFTSISLDDLLNLQYENKEKYETFDGMVIFDTMNLTSFIFKKFYDLKKE
jgi:Ras GTPase-activating-like protein IQGAP2/3